MEGGRGRGGGGAGSPLSERFGGNIFKKCPKKFTDDDQQRRRRRRKNYFLEKQNKNDLNSDVDR